MRMAPIIAWSALLLCLLTDRPAAAQQVDQSACPGILKTHGFLSRAQFQCKFQSYSRDMIDSASRCSKAMNDAEVKQLLRSGMDTFDRNEGERGHAALCRDILTDFPGVVRN
jgi:hypothetical protein